MKATSGDLFLRMTRGPVVGGIIHAQKEIPTLTILSDFVWSSTCRHSLILVPIAHLAFVFSKGERRPMIRPREPQSQVLHGTSMLEFWECRSRPCLIDFKILKFYNIFHHIEYFNGMK